jgi:N-carbamoylputrescine amidase
MPTELSTTQYFPACLDQRYFDWAEPIPGPSTELFAKKAKQYEVCLILPLYERATIESVYYNSAVVIGPDGKIVKESCPMVPGFSVILRITYLICLYPRPL